MTPGRPAFFHPLPRVVLAALVTLSLLSSALLTSCGEPKGTRPQDRADMKVLRYVSSDGVKTLDPQGTSWLIDFRVIETVFEPLLRLDPQTLEVVPGVAKRYSLSSDGRVYTFHLRDDANWSNGDPVTAWDFVFAWKRALLPEEAADYTGLFFYINGAKAYFDYAKALDEAYREALTIEANEDASFETILGTVMSVSDSPGDAMRRAGLMTDDRDFLFEIKQKLLDDHFVSTVGLSVIDDTTLEVRMAEPTPFFPQLAAFAAFMPQHRESVLAAAEKDFATGWLSVDPDYYMKPDRLVGNGAFRLRGHVIQESLTVEPNPYYWNRDGVKLDRIVMYVNDDEQNYLLQYQRGEIDWVPGVPGGSEAAPELKAQSESGQRNDVHIVPAAGVYYYSFNCRPEVDGKPNPLHDARVRQALAMTIDRDTIVNQVTRMGQPTLATFVPPGAVNGYEPPADAGLRFDPEAARALLAEAGYPDGDGFPQIGILINTEGDHQRIAERIRRDWADHLGIDVRIEAMERQTFSDRIKRQHNFHVARSSWYGDYQDPTTWLDMLRSFDGNNDRGYNNPDYDAMLAEATLILDPEKRFAKLREAEALMLGEAPLCPIYQFMNISVFDAERIKNLYVSPWGIRRLDVVELVDPAAETTTETEPETATPTP